MTEQSMSLGEIIKALKDGSGSDIDLNVPLAGGIMPLGQVSSTEYVSLMLDNGADPNVTDKSGMHPLVNVMCYYTGRDDRAIAAEIANLMLARGLDVNRVNQGRTLLAEAAYYDLPELSVLLLENGADTSTAEDAIRIAQDAGAMDTLLAVCGFLGVSADDFADGARISIDDLFANYVDPEPGVTSRDGIGHTPLHLAAEFGADHLLAELVEMGADLEARNNSGKTPVFMALNSDLDEDTMLTTIKSLADLGAKLDAKNDAGQSLVDYAKDARCPAGVIEYLESEGVS